MLYYIIKFIKRCIEDPRNIVGHFKRIREEFRAGRAAMRFNEMIYVFADNSNNFHPTYVETAEGTICYFEHIEFIVKYLNAAQYSIDIAIYAMSADPIGAALRRAHERGVIVRVLCEKNLMRLLAKYTDCMLVRKLLPIKWAMRGDTMMHHKICIIDGYQRVKELAPSHSTLMPTTVALTGSLNWVGQPKSWDDYLAVSNPKICKRLEQEFIRLWDSVNLKPIK